MDQNKLLLASMKMISEAGDAQDLIKQSLDAVKTGNYLNSKEILDKAHVKLKNAHIEQTHILQKSMELQDEYSASLLFSHAQDTLMTINSEFLVSCQLLDLYHSLDIRIKKLENDYDKCK